MKKIIYLYLPELLAEWEIGYILQAVAAQKMLKAAAVGYTVKTFSCSKEPVKTIGGLSLNADCMLADINEAEMAALLLPGAESWDVKKDAAVLELASRSLDNGILVAAICGATLALANMGLLDNYRHTSNSLEYLQMFSAAYNGSENYVTRPACSDSNLITASSAGGLLWARYIIEYLGMYTPEIIESWYNYFLTGDGQYYTELLRLSGSV